MNKNVFFTIFLKLFILFFLNLNILFPINIYAQVNQNIEGLVVGPSKIILEMSQGETKTGIVKYKNNSQSSLELNFYIERFESSEESIKFIPKENDSNPEFISQWLTIPENQISINPGETKEINYTLTIPPNIKSGGKYFALTARNSSSSLSTNSTFTQFAYEVSTLFFITVKGELNNEIVIDTFKANEVIFENFTAGFQTILKNTGDIHEIPKGNILIKNAFNEIVITIPFNSKSDVLLPSSIHRFEDYWQGGFWKKYNSQSTIPHLGIGVYKAELIINYNKEQKTAIATTSFLIIPWKYILLLFVLVLILPTLWRKLFYTQE